MSIVDRASGSRTKCPEPSDAERPGGLVIDDQLEFRLHHRQVRGLHVLEDAAGVDADLTPRTRNVGSVAHESAGFGRFARRNGDGDRVLCRQDGNLNPSDDKKVSLLTKSASGRLRPKAAVRLPP
jgi:hypothetical protein